ncbi:MAG: MBL fold metallo-hydrolase [Cellvibrionaceae bacterium]|nr:MBL fold metallo-hydrolase [Cellvibrionaceae bacterium]
MPIRKTDDQMDSEFGVPRALGGGIYQLKMPLPFRLDHINLYLIDNDHSWVLIDTGLNHADVKRYWKNLFVNFFNHKPIAKIILTHLHPDHIGLAGWLQRQLDVEVFISQQDWNMAQRLWRIDQAQGEFDFRRHYACFGLSQAHLQALVDNRAGYKKLVKDLPCRVSILSANSILEIGGSSWKVLGAKGHSPEHLCLWNQREGVLISGDHILPTITPNISLMVYGLNDPLYDYLQSLHEYSQLPCKTYYPAHGVPSVNYSERIRQLMAHHQLQLEKLLSTKINNFTIEQAVSVLFDKPIAQHQQLFALGEAAAHLMYLVNREKLKHQGGDTWYFNRIVDEQCVGFQAI